MQPNKFRTLPGRFTLLLALLLLAACGQSGPLYLPDTAEPAAGEQPAEAPQSPEGGDGGAPAEEMEPAAMPDPADPEDDDLAQ